MFSKISKIIGAKNSLCKAARTYSSSISTRNENPGRVVFISQSSDVYSNLAFEDWLYKNWNFSKRNVLLLWKNSPCVVIGRHQNPLVEANTEYLDTAGVPVVRRNSGGGTVYHDDGNLNCTFFTSRERYNRRDNLDLICSALQKDFNIPAEVNDKDDILVGNDYKVSGTAAKLGPLSAYHHCTLLVSSDKLQLKLALKGDKTLKSKATESVPALVANLQDLYPHLSIEKVLGSIGKNYLEHCASDGTCGASNYTRSDGFTVINPSEDWFPGLDAMKAKLKSWDWFLGMTPLFKQTRPIGVHHAFSEGSAVLVSVEVFHGVVKSITVESNVGPILKELIEGQIGNSLKGAKYTADLFVEIESRLFENDAKPQYSSA